MPYKPEEVIKLMGYLPSETMLNLLSKLPSIQIINIGTLYNVHNMWLTKKEWHALRRRALKEPT